MNWYLLLVVISDLYPSRRLTYPPYTTRVEKSKTRRGGIKKKKKKPRGDITSGMVIYTVPVPDVCNGCIRRRPEGRD